MKTIKTILSRRSFVFLFLGILLLYLTFPTGLALGQDGGEDEKILNALKEAQDLYLRAEYAPAIERFQQAIRQIKEAGKEKLYEGKVVNAYLAMGVCHLGLNDMENAKKAFFEVVRIRPDFELDPVFYSPKVVSAFEEARAEFRRIAEEEKMKREEEERRKAEELRKDEEKRKAEEVKVVGEKGKEKEKPAAAVVIGKARKESGEKKVKKRRFPWLLVVGGIVVVSAALFLIANLKKVEKPSFTFEHVMSWGSAGSGNGQFDRLDDIAVDNAGYCYVVDAGNNRIQKFTTDGQYVGQWSVGNPGGVAVDSNSYVYVSSWNQYCINKYTPSGKWVSTVVARGSSGMCIYQNYLYTTDWNESKVRIYDLMGNLQREWGGPGTGDGFFNHTSDIATDAQGNVYVVDQENNRVQKFSPDGSFLLKFGQSEINTCKGVVIDSNGDIFVADCGNDRICKYSPSGVYIGAGSLHGGGCSGQMAIDSQGYLYVTLWENRVEKYRIH